MIKRGVWYVVVAAACLLSACGGQGLQPLSDDAVILAFGDSLTAGNGVSQQQAYPAVLERLSGRTVINAGVSGEVTSEGVQRLPSLLRQHQPDLVILLEGGNDILQNKSMASAKDNLSQMIELSRQQGASVLLVGVPKKSLFASTAEFYAELADEHGVPLQSKVIGSLLKMPSMKSDSVHFNAAGYEALATAIYEKLDDIGAL